MKPDRAFIEGLPFSELIAMRDEMLRRGTPQALDYLKDHYLENGDPKYPESIKRRRDFGIKLESIESEITKRIYENH